MSLEVPEVTIIIPMYNAESYIDKTLMSIQQQTYDDFDVMIIDDASTDTSVSVVQEFQQSGELKDKIKLLRLKKNGGISNARNLGLRLARSKYISFVDNDDFLLPNSLETFIKMANEYNADIVHTHSHYQNRMEISDDDVEMNFKPSSFEYGNKKHTKDPAHLLTLKMQERITDLIEYRLDWNVWGKLFRRDFLMLYDIKFPKITYTEDMLFCFQCLLHAKRYLLIPDLLYVYRYRSSSELHGDRDKTFMNKIINVQIEGTRYLNEYMDTIKYFKSNPKERDRIISFYVRLEMMATKQMQKKFGKDLDYYQELQKMYSKHFEKDSALLAYLHIMSNR